MFPLVLALENPIQFVIFLGKGTTQVTCEWTLHCYNYTTLPGTHWQTLANHKQKQPPNGQGMDLPGLASHLHQALSVKEGSLESQKELWRTITGACHRGVEYLGFLLTVGMGLKNEGYPKEVKEPSENIGKLMTYVNTVYTLKLGEQYFQINPLQSLEIWPTHHYINILKYWEIHQQ